MWHRRGQDEEELFFLFVSIRDSKESVICFQKNRRYNVGKSERNCILAGNVERGEEESLKYRCRRG